MTAFHQFAHHYDTLISFCLFVLIFGFGVLLRAWSDQLEETKPYAHLILLAAVSVLVVVSGTWLVHNEIHEHRFDLLKTLILASLLPGLATTWLKWKKLRAQEAQSRKEATA